ncbi:MAG: serine/threonine-protein kinase [Vicinamibacterales bacterium]
MPVKVVAPRLPTPGPPLTAPSGVITSRLPDDVVAEQVQRLKLFAVISGGMWAMGLVMDFVIFPNRMMADRATTASLIIELAAIALAAGVYFYVEYAPRSPHVKADAGLALMLLNSAGIALLETWVVDPTHDSLGHLSWIPIVILLSAMVMPTVPRRMLVAALASASMGPIGVWMAHWRGVEVPGVLDTLAMAVPNYSCAIAAVLPSQMFHRMGKRLREARDLGNYQLVERLGVGGMGEVWRARHRLLASDAAVKLVRQEILGASENEARAQLRRFEREAQATATLSSQHTIRLFDFGSTDDGSFYYVMELLVGQDLESLVKKFGPLPADRVLFLLGQVCHSLAEAHARGLVHRDVKPANIFACRMGLDYDFVKVLDFGLVQHREVAASENITETLVTAERLIGTPAYLAPEIILGSTDVDRRADVYALGCVAYFLLTGQRVFQEGSAMQALIDHVQTPPAAPSRKSPLPVPRQVDELVLACLKKKREDRPQDASELLELIAAIPGAGHAWSSAHAQAWWQTHLPELALASRAAEPLNS